MYLNRDWHFTYGDKDAPPEAQAMHSAITGTKKNLNLQANNPSTHGGNAKLKTIVQRNVKTNNNIVLQERNAWGTVGPCTTTPSSRQSYITPGGINTQIEMTNCHFVNLNQINDERSGPLRETFGPNTKVPKNWHYLINLS